MTRPTFKQQVLQAREDAIIESVNRLLADKGFDLMTVDEVAADVGIAKASLYKHFASKEALAAAAMVRLMERTQAVVDQQAARAEATPVQRLMAMTRWALQTQLRGDMPTVPSQNSSLRAELMADKAYLDAILRISDTLGSWIQQAQASGDIDPDLPPEVVLYTIYARACDPVPAFLKAGGNFTDEQIVELVQGTCWRGLARVKT